MSEGRGREELPKYLKARIHQALAEDPRTHLLDVQIELSGRRVFVMGTVESEERRNAAQQVVEENIPTEVSVVNELWVASYTAPSETEELP